ncbi:outer membrane protein, OmpA family protein [Legionella lansingensis]|uniref:Outer membrane protein, OmpA family protein n=1 Tax=Legionella lansingensis TaxID=45067 RepID=A0A0W0VQ34_9GAMM|nr:C-OmpA-like family protein CmpA [Legionella lansingensis]KTD22122.1 outer membrane protein, OmpA family protein [Legionella lansingensis]SNV54329.1 outer membrane protein, OmpA family protein [Legionella lansingensis]
MLRKSSVRPLAFIGLMSLALTSCYKYHPPYNNFKPYHRVYVTTPPGAAAGTAAMAIAGGPVLAGTGAGAAFGAGIGLYKDSKREIIKQLQKRQIQYIQYGDTVTLVVPTDKYFMFNSPRLNPICFSGLALLIKLIRMFPSCCPIYVAGFTNDVGSRYHKKKLTQAQAEAMLTFLWANGIPAQRLNAEGYGDKHPVSDNELIHGSAQNRRLEIQVLCNCSSVQAPAPLTGYVK